jgi:hypothetical protein
MQAFLNHLGHSSSMLGPMFFALVHLVAAADDPHHLRRESPAVIIADQHNQRSGPSMLFPGACAPQGIEPLGLHPAIHFRWPGFNFPDIEVQRFHTGKAGVFKSQFQGFSPDGLFETHIILIAPQFLQLRGDRSPGAVPLSCLPVFDGLCAVRSGRFKRNRSKCHRYSFKPRLNPF